MADALTSDEAIVKPQNVTWDQYTSIIQRGRPLAEVLKLSPKSSYIRTVSEQSVTYGSEIYHDFGTVIARAITKGDPELLDYFIRDLNNAKRVSYDRIFVAAIKAYRTDLIETFLDIRDDRMKNPDYKEETTYDDTYREIGIKGYHQYMTQVLYPRLNSGQPYNGNIHYIGGLLLGEHHDLITEPIGTSLAPYVIAVGAEERYPEAVKNVTSDDIALALTYHPDPNILVRYEKHLGREKTFALLVTIDPDLALEYYDSDPDAIERLPSTISCDERIWDLYREMGQGDLIELPPQCESNTIIALHKDGFITRDQVSFYASNHQDYSLISYLLPDVPKHLTDEAQLRGNYDLALLPYYLSGDIGEIVFFDRDIGKNLPKEKPPLNILLQAAL